ncbi:MAG TPA: hypothetical protein VKT81_23160 [Bryobacteraceae bacterium]|nr:hypothetical protein [Bryobacteraceae bacterium]
MSPLSTLLDRLDAAKRQFDPGAQSSTSKLLEAVGRKTFSDAAALIRFHEALLFLRAYPANENIRRLAVDLLASFQGRVAKLGDNLEPFEEPDVSGISGTAFSAIFTYDIARWLVAQHPTRVDIDWDATDPTLLGPLLRRLHPYFAEDLLVEANIPYMDWFRAAKRERGRDLAWLISRIEKFPMTPEDRAELYAGAKIAIRWDLGHGPMTRSNIHLGGARKFFYHDRPLLRRADVSLASELAAAKIPTRKCSRAQGEDFLDLARETSAMRYRELHGFTYGDPSSVIHAELGRGVEVFVNGVPKKHRLPLRTYHSGMYFKNAVPIGYIECLTLSDRMEVGFNLYYTFREGETAWLYGRLLHLFRQLAGVNYFAVDPYQIGHHNDEAIDSGAFWFYRKLGFRPTDPMVAKILAREEKKMKADPLHRTTPATLRRLAASWMIYETAGAKHGKYDNFEVRRLAMRHGGKPH